MSCFCCFGRTSQTSMYNSLDWLKTLTFQSYTLRTGSFPVCLELVHLKDSYGLITT